MNYGEEIEVWVEDDLYLVATREDSVWEHFASFESGAASVTSSSDWMPSVFIIISLCFIVLYLYLFYFLFDYINLCLLFKNG